MKIHSVLPTTTLNGCQAYLNSSPVFSDKDQKEPKSSSGLGLKIANTSVCLASLAAITIFSPELGVALMGLFIIEPKKF